MVNICSPMPGRRSSPEDRLTQYLSALRVAGASQPTIREVAAELGYRSTNAAMKLIVRMREAGKVAYQPGKARSLRLADQPEAGVPVLGSIPAGFPGQASEETPEVLPVASAVFGIVNPGDAFALRVHGNSMTGRQLFDGDLVILDRSARPKDHDVVAALIDQECTLKTLVVKDGVAWLKAENPAYPDLIPAHDLEIQGVAKAVIRILAA